ncbi:MAG: biotin/lipoyl-containing protein [Anaerolineae bacterium]
MATYEITVNGIVYTIEIGDVSSSPIDVVVNGETKTVTFSELQAKTVTPAPVIAKPVEKPAPKPVAKVAPAPVGSKKVTAPMPGKILSVKVKVGDQVKEGDPVCTLEAMKMEMPISATTSGTIKAIHVAVGDSVAYNDPLVSLE